MKRKILIIVASVMMLVCACIGLSACGEHTHKFKKYIYNNDATCTEDGTETGRCECGETDTRVKEGTARGHRFGDWISDDNATCIANCTQTRYCKLCSATETEDIPDSKVWHSVTFHEGTATCTESGSVPYYECNFCHTKYKDADATWEETDFEPRVLGHEFNAENKCLRYDVCETEWECTEASKLEFRLNDDQLTYSLKRVNASGSIILPYGYNGKYVTAIENEAFSGVSIRGITFTERITSIGDSAFKGTNLAGTLTLPERLTHLGKDAFNGCTRLTGIILPDSLTEIEEGVFYNCNKITGITLGKNVTSIGNQAFSQCSSVTGDLVIPDTVESIGDRAFTDLGVSTITLGSGLKEIGAGAFQLCTQITSLVIPASVVSIGEGAFLNCSGLTSVTFEAPTGWYLDGETDALSGLEDVAVAATLLRREHSDVAWEKR